MNENKKNYMERFFTGVQELVELGNIDQFLNKNSLKNNSVIKR